MLVSHLPIAPLLKTFNQGRVGGFAFGFWDTCNDVVLSRCLLYPEHYRQSCNPYFFLVVGIVRGQCGQLVRTLDLQFGGPEFKSWSGPGCSKVG